MRRKENMQQEKSKKEKNSDFEPDWSGKCDACDMSPVVPASGMCGPCTFGEANTINGNW